MDYKFSGGDVHFDLMRDHAKTFPEVADAERYRSARLWYCKLKTVKGIDALCNLEVLVIAGYPDASLDNLIGLRKLRYLSIIDLPKVSSLSALAQLQNIEDLSLATLPSWDSKSRITTVDSLAPIVELPNISHLELLGVCPPERSPGLLTKCGALKSARFSKYDPAAVQNFYLETSVENKSVPDPVFY